MHSDQCPYCRKWVCHKPLLGTLHFCLTAEERWQIDHARWAVEMQKRAQSIEHLPWSAFFTALKRG